MLAGAWVLAFLPLSPVLHRSGLDKLVPVVTPFNVKGIVVSLDHTLTNDVYSFLAFCVGVVLLFAKERGRRANPLDWTRRWGVLMSYLVFLLGAAVLLIVPGLVLVGVAAIFNSIPSAFQPQGTVLINKLAYGIVYYAPTGGRPVEAVLAGFSAVVVLLAGVPLYQALCSCGRRRTAFVLLAPLAIAAAAQCVIAVQHGLVASNIHWIRIFFFEPIYFTTAFSYTTPWANVSPGYWRELVVAAVKWAAVLAIAIRLTVAQIAAWCRGKGQQKNAFRIDANEGTATPAAPT